MKRAGWIRVVALMAIFAGRVDAQDGDGIRPGFGAVYLLRHPAVQADLKMGGSQVEKASAVVSNLQARQNELFLKLEGLAGEERTKKKVELSVVLDEEAGKAFVGLLDPGQLARFGQIDLQQRGASAWLDPKLARMLDLTADQSDKITKILNQAMVRRREAQSTTRGNRRASTEKVEAIRVETDAQAVALLTSAQVATWNRLTGEPLDLRSAR